jgi:hypothetical protein
LLADVIDYAGLFPPAELDLPRAFANYSAYRRGPHAWMLARFVVPAGKLDELARMSTPARGDPIRLSVVVRAGDEVEAFMSSFAEDLVRIHDFARRAEGRFIVDALEARPPSEFPISSMDEWSKTLTPHASWLNAALFLEIGFADFERKLSRWRTGLPEAFNQRVGFKWRCGGAAAAAIPSTEIFARVVYECRLTGVDWKATAGLHHPFPRQDAALGARLHGFVNVLGAAALAFGEKLGEAELRDVLSSDDPAEWRFSDDELRWRDRRVSTAKIAISRRHFGASFGSCSFDEPVEDLQTLGWL